MASANAGWINRAWMFLSGAENGLFNVYSFGGLVFVSALYAIPYIFIYVSDGLSSVSSEMEDAARMLGAGPVGVAIKVTLPLVAPAIFNGCLIVFLDTIALFGTPIVLGLPAHFNVAAVQLLEFSRAPAFRSPLAAVVRRSSLGHQDLSFDGSFGAMIFDARALFAMSSATSMTSLATIGLSPRLILSATISGSMEDPNSSAASMPLTPSMWPAAATAMAASTNTGMHDRAIRKSGIAFRW